MNIYYGIPSGSQINFEEKEVAKRLISTLSALPCQTKDFTPEDPHPFEAMGGAPSLIHAFNLTKAGIQCAKLAEKSRLPLIISCSGIDIYSEIYNDVARSQLKEALEYANCVIVPFSAMAKFIKTRLQVRSKVKVITPGILPVGEDIELKLHRFGLAENDRIIMLEGGLIPSKNALFAIHSLDKIIGNYPGLRLVIFDQPADPDYREKVLAEIAEKPWIKIIPRPESEQMPFIFDLAEIVINTSHAEGYNPFLLMAMQRGIPVLASDIQGNSNYIKSRTSFPENETGLLYSTAPTPTGHGRIHDADDFTDKITELLDDPEIARQMGKRAQVEIKKTHSIEKELFLHLQLYKQILQR